MIMYKMETKKALTAVGHAKMIVKKAAYQIMLVWLVMVP